MSFIHPRSWSRSRSVADETARSLKRSLQQQKPARRETSPLVLKELHDLSPQARQEIAHRLNNRMQVILGAAELHAHEPGDSLSEGILRAVDAMRADLRELFGI